MLLSIFPENVSTYGAEVDFLFWFILAFVLIAFVISLFVLIYPLYKFSASRNKTATHFTGEKKTHYKWIVTALVLLGASDFVILFAEHGTWDKIQSLPQQEDLRIGITGRQWNWIFTYPGPDGKLMTADDIVIDEQNSELHIPVNKNVVFELRSRDVVHSFYVPKTRIKQDVIPGRVTTAWFNITKEGRYELICAEICGIMHSSMRNFIVAESQESYEAYLAGQQPQ